MEFLVEITNTWPADGDPDRKAGLALAESGRAAELARDGILKKLWRIPGTSRNVGLWVADDATALHAALTSLPFFPWLEITVRPLAAHPNDPGTRQV